MAVTAKIARTARAAVILTICCIGGFLAVSPFLKSTPGEAEAIPPSEMTIVSERAKSGDIRAIQRLVNHYLFYEDDEKLAYFWALKGANLGDDSMRKFVLLKLSKGTSDVDAAKAASLAKAWNLPLPIERAASQQLIK